KSSDHDYLLGCFFFYGSMLHDTQSFPGIGYTQPPQQSGTGCNLHPITFLPVLGSVYKHWPGIKPPLIFAVSFLDNFLMVF
ncbi:hypothetical protein, partial [Chryseobacterium arthrosphaerae]|uniref:hypothetical protein n=1 Tax=Chryseobacterium arthrosphaerae TaxID=651561 RepID=UPI00241C4DEA